MPRLHSLCVCVCVCVCVLKRGVGEHLAPLVAMPKVLSFVTFVLQNGIVHRDLKLENIFIDGKGDAKVQRNKCQSQTSHGKRGFLVHETSS